MKQEVDEREEKENKEGWTLGVTILFQEEKRRTVFLRTEQQSNVYVRRKTPLFPSRGTNILATISKAPSRRKLMEFLISSSFQSKNSETANLKQANSAGIQQESSTLRHRVLQEKMISNISMTASLALTSSPLENIMNLQKMSAEIKDRSKCWGRVG